MFGRDAPSIEHTPPTFECTLKEPASGLVHHGEAAAQPYDTDSTRDAVIANAHHADRDCQAYYFSLNQRR